jgi:hypothetical protein
MLPLYTGFVGAFDCRLRVVCNQKKSETPTRVNVKKLLVCAALAAIVLDARAQGTFTFSNRAIAVGLDQPVIDTKGNTYDLSRATKLEGPNYVAAIFLNGQQLGGVAPFRTGAGAGYWNPGADSTRTIIGRFSGDVVSGFTVKAWDFSKGPTLEAARVMGGWYYGESRTFNITLGGAKADPNLPEDLPGAMTNFQSFYVTCGCPEPAVGVLGALGAVALLVRRRI